MQKSLVIALAIISISACGNSNINEAKKAVKESLKDPESAVFEELQVSPTGSVCGSANAKNSYGGYTGKKYFAYEKGTLYWAVNSEPPSEVLDEVAFYDRQIAEIQKVREICKAASQE